jgi:hypothetical protein
MTEEDDNTPAPAPPAGDAATKARWMKQALNVDVTAFRLHEQWNANLASLEKLATKGSDEKFRADNLKSWYGVAQERGDTGFAEKIVAAAAAAGNPKQVVVSPPLDKKACHAIIKSARDWGKVKEQYLAQKERMQELKAYRKEYVDQLLAELKSKMARDLLAKSVGSDNPSSDYDVTLGSPSNPGVEIDVVRAFNSRVQEDFGAPPGVVFDTNLYVKDFLELKGNVSGLEGTDGAKIDSPDGIHFGTSDDSDQDVGSLIKQRQYMPADDWNAYAKSIKDGLKGQPEKLHEATQQFEEADGLYLTNMREKAALFFRKLKTAKPPIERSPHLAELEAWFDGLADKSYSQALDNEMQRKLDEVAAVSQHDAPDIALAANNEIYLDKMVDARKLQNRHRALEGIAGEVAGTSDPTEKLKLIGKKLDELYPAPIQGEAGTALAKQLRKEAEDAVALLQKNPDLDIDIWLKDKIEALKAQAKKQIAEANFHAPEAYLSEGALEHVVGGNQSKDAKALENMSPQQFLQSMNEQFGDFLKDVGHYKSDDGKAFVQTSKYLQRMIESMNFMLTKLDMRDVLASIPAPFDNPAALNGLLSIRGPKPPYDKLPDDERWLAGTKAAIDLFGVGKIDALRSKIVALNAQVSAAVRARLELQAKGTEVPAYHRNRDKQVSDVA